MVRVAIVDSRCSLDVTTYTIMIVMLVLHIGINTVCPGTELNCCESNPRWVYIEKKDNTIALHWERPNITVDEPCGVMQYYIQYYCGEMDPQSVSCMVDSTRVYYYGTVNISNADLQCYFAVQVEIIQGCTQRCDLGSLGRQTFGVPLDIKSEGQIIIL